jgi:hypothetical protein
MYAVNLVAVFFVSLLSVVVCWLWYSPWAFGKRWMDLAVVSEVSLGLQGMVLGFLAFLARNYVLAVVLNFARVRTMYEGALVGLLVAAGFFVSAQLGEMIHEKKPPRLVLIHGGYFLVSLMVMGAILGIWR